jgi:hypothetical protein
MSERYDALLEKSEDLRDQVSVHEAEGLTVARACSGAAAARHAEDTPN